jgi:Helicase conserved C-terminal domain
MKAEVQMSDHITNRDAVLRALRQELVGPSPLGQEIDCTGPIQFDEIKEAYRPYCQLGSGEEILQRVSPTKRYGVGVLFPMDARIDTQNLEAQFPSTDANIDISRDERDTAPVLKSAIEDCAKIADRAESRLPEADSDDLDLSGANTYRPSSMAVSFLVLLPKESEIFITATGGRYSIKKVCIIGKEREWWLRSPVHISGKFCRADFPESEPSFVAPCNLIRDNLVNLDVQLELYARPKNHDEFLVTVCLVNRQTADERYDTQCLFQAHLNIQVDVGGSLGTILPYPTAAPLDDEEHSQELLYREKLTFAVGHGCAADWIRDDTPIRANCISAECLPIFEAPNITPDIYTDAGQPLIAPMRALGGLDANDDGLGAVETIVNMYETWIANQRNRIGSLDERMQKTARDHLDRCTESALRMRDGLLLLSNDRQIRKAFTLANRAILIQQIRSRREARIALFDQATSKLLFNEPYEPIDLNSAASKKCAWRAFQIAFILASLRSTADAHHVDRDLVELIWFPTGGGKTEAYLGLAAFSIFLRRLRDPRDTGVQTLMRYTLRLLTAQQFQRASRLVCAMEYLRRQDDIALGNEEISIGIWLGGSTTPNTRKDALDIFRSLCKGDKAKENQFVLDRCPWCGAQMGPVELLKGQGRKKDSSVPKVIGYEMRNKTIVYACPDFRCEFHNSMPLYVIDEDIYEVRPALVIGTVDKFAMLAWKPEARSLFGIASNGNREHSPPGLIIQDELHLISGPLGSMVGLYEPVVEELCTDRRNLPPVKPKIISSTATIRSFREQVRGLYARERTCLFPPPGLDADDSFFARIACAPDGSTERGRIYVGVHAPGLGSLQTVQVRTFAALLQATQPLSPMERDPWWTLLLFFNSLRELGTTLTLFQSDIPDLLKGSLRQRLGLSYQNIRTIRKMLELTGRLPGDEVPKAITALEVPTDSHQGHAVDVCLASNIIEVGVDIDRLSLMAVVGQPKTTSQYIQVTGRVGRKRERPGLVVTIYTASKPRDRSHFEKFRSYHERLYAQVEPTSVTPFSRPALDRAVHAVVASYVRQLGNSDQADKPYPFPETLFLAVSQILVQRARSIDPDELEALQRILGRRSDEWKRWQRSKWSGSLVAEDIPLLRPSGAYVSPEKERISWATPQSLRNVDAECQVEITQLYMQEDAENA